MLFLRILLTSFSKAMQRYNDFLDCASFFYIFFEKKLNIFLKRKDYIDNQYFIQSLFFLQFYFFIFLSFQSSYKAFKYMQNRFVHLFYVL